MSGAVWNARALAFKGEGEKWPLESGTCGEMPPAGPRKGRGDGIQMRVCASRQVQTEEMCWRWWTDGRTVGGAAAASVGWQRQGASQASGSKKLQNYVCVKSNA